MATTQSPSGLTAEPTEAMDGDDRRATGVVAAAYRAPSPTDTVGPMASSPGDPVAADPFGTTSLRSRTSLAAGATAFIVILCLRHLGVLQGPLAIAVVLASISLSPSTQRVSTRFLLAFATIFGFLPLLGWIPGLGTTVDIPGVLLAATVAVVCADRFRRTGARPSGNAAASSSEALAAVVAIGAGLWWGLPLLRMATTRQLAFLFRGYDNVTHFQMFRSDLMLGSFTLVRPRTSPGQARLNWDYPQGMHNAFAQLLRLWNPHPPATDSLWMLHAYVALLIALMAGILLALCLAIARASRYRFVVAAPGMAVVLALFAFGPFQTLNGFPNFDLAVAAAATAIMLMVSVRLPPRLELFIVAGMFVVTVYGWYPLALITLPALGVSLLRLRRMPAPHRRWQAGLATGLLLVVAALPAAGFAHRGVSQLAIPGGEVAAPWGRLFLVLAALGMTALYGHVRGASRGGARFAVGAPILLGAPCLGLLIAYELASQHNFGGQHIVGYYGQKLGLGLFAIASLVLTGALADLATTRLARRSSRISRPTLIVFGALATLGLLQVYGYVGPLSQSLSGTDGSVGLAVHDQLLTSHLYQDRASELLASLRLARSREAQPGASASQWWLIDPTPSSSSLDTHFDLYALWFDVLNAPDPTVAHERPVMSLARTIEVTQPSAYVAAEITAAFRSQHTDRLHLLVPAWLKAAMVQADPRWASPGTLVVPPA